MTEYAFDVFLSYAQVNIEFSRKLASWLRTAGYRVWLAEEQLVPGTRFRAGLEQGLRESRHLLAVLTESYSARRWTQREIDLFDLSAETTDRRILGIQIGDIGKGPLDQVFLVHQRIKWKGSDFDPEGFWLLHCGLRDQRPGPRSDWGSKGQQLISRVCQTQQEKRPFPSRDSDFLVICLDEQYVQPVEDKAIDTLVSGCLSCTSAELQSCFARLQKQSKETSVRHTTEQAITSYWTRGQAERATILSLAFLPDLCRHYSSWALLDMGFGEAALWFLVILSLSFEMESEIWLSWAVSEMAWPYLMRAAQKAPPQLQEHFTFIAKAAYEQRSPFRKVEEKYDYGIMITPWNHFHLCWLAIRLRDIAAAIAHVEALCSTALHGDVRTGRFLTRVCNWPIFEPVLLRKHVKNRVDKARMALGLETIGSLEAFRHRFKELWQHVQKNIGEINSLT